jgi:hypothetical protein
MDTNDVTGKAKGGRARALALKPEERKSIAQHAAAVRWGKSRPVLKKGNFQEELGIDIDCYVLDDARKTAVISQRGMGQAIGFSKRGDRLAIFAKSQTMAEFIGRELIDKIENPIIFQRPGSAAENPISDKAHGYDAALLIDICKAILAARSAGKLSGPRYSRMVQQAEIVLGACAKNGIRQLVYAVSGYNPSAEEVISAFKAYVQEEAKKYEPEFPNELYMHWHRLYEIPVPAAGKPWYFAYLTVRHIYHPLAKSGGKIYDLLKALKVGGGDRRKKLFQFLNIIGARALRIHLGRILEMAEDSKTREEYEHRVSVRFGDQLELEFLAPSDASAPPPPA